ncbi:MAG: hypothetical protein ACRDTT_27965, partial [Pseudonocardiaceae bacterium]
WRGHVRPSSSTTFSRRSGLAASRFAEGPRRSTGRNIVIRIRPERMVAWGLDEPETMRNARDVRPR